MLRQVTPEALELFGEMVDAHEEAGSGDRVFITAGGMADTAMIFAGGGLRRNWQPVDPGALEDLARAGLLSEQLNGRGEPFYRVTGAGLNFHRGRSADVRAVAPVLTVVEKQALEPLVREVRSLIEALEDSDADPNDLADARAQADTLDAQLRAARPRRSVVAATASALRDVAVGALGGALGNGLTQVAGKILEAIGS